MFRFRKLLSLSTALLLLCALLTGCGQKKDVTELKAAPALRPSPTWP